jgi:methyltransferase (TIGR00027 family)
MSGAPHVQESRLAAVARTARWTAAARARESRRADRLFADPFAEALAGADGASLLRHFDTAWAPNGGNPVLAIRTRWFDDFVSAAALTTHQIVGLAAGLDTRAYRLNWPAGRTLFEVDQPAVLSYKEETLAATDGRPRCVVRRVRADLVSPDWPTALVEAGFDPTAPAAWFVEGLLYYLPEALAHEIIARVAELSAPGSVLAVDVLNTGVFRLPYLQPLLRKLQELHSPWLFGTDTPGDFVAGCGWRPTGVTEPGQPGADYGRWSPPASTVRIPGLPRNFLVSAEKA